MTTLEFTTMSEQNPEVNYCNSITQQLSATQTKLKGGKRIICSSSKIKLNNILKQKCKTYQNSKCHQQNHQQSFRNDDQSIVDVDNNNNGCNNQGYNKFSTIQTTHTPNQDIYQLEQPINKLHIIKDNVLKKQNIKRSQAVYTQLYAGEKTKSSSIMNTYINSNKSTLQYISKSKRNNKNHSQRYHGNANYSTQQTNNNKFKTQRYGAFTSAYMGAITNLNLDFDCQSFNNFSIINNVSNKKIQTNNISNCSQRFNNTSRNKQTKLGAGFLHTSTNNNRSIKVSKNSIRLIQEKNKNGLFNNKIIKSSIVQKSVQKFIKNKAQVLKAFYLDKPEIRIKQIKRNKLINTSTNKSYTNKWKGDTCYKNNKILINPNIFNVYRPTTNILLINVDSNYLI